MFVNSTNYLDTLFGRPDVSKFNPMGDLEMRRGNVRKIKYEDYRKYIKIATGKEVE